jgi:hypothetical protein
MRKRILISCAIIILTGCNNYASIADLKFPKRESLTANRDANHRLTWHKVIIEDKSPYSAIMQSYSMSGELTETEETVGSPTESFTYKNGKFARYDRRVNDGHCVSRYTYTQSGEREIKFCPTFPIYEYSEDRKTQVKRSCAARENIYRCEEWKGTLLVRATEQQLDQDNAPWQHVAYTSNGFTRTDFKVVMRLDTPTQQKKDFFRQDTSYDIQGRQISQSLWVFDGDLVEIGSANRTDSWTYRDRDGELEYHHSSQGSL